MPGQHDKATIVSMAVIASALATLLHEGIGHGVTAWLRGDIETRGLASNHLSDVRPDRWVDARGTIVNLIVGACFWMASRRAGGRANARYFLFILAALNLLPGAGYFLFSGIIGVGDWNEVIRGLPHQVELRIAMSLFRALHLYVRGDAATGRRCPPVRPGRSGVQHRVPHPVLRRLHLQLCGLGALDPLGLKVFSPLYRSALFGGLLGLCCGPIAGCGRLRRSGIWWSIGRPGGGSRPPWWEPARSLCLAGASSSRTRVTYDLMK